MAGILFEAKVVKGPLLVRSKPDNSNMTTAISVLRQDTIIQVLRIENDWVLHNYGGWSLLKEDDIYYIKSLQQIEDEENLVLVPNMKIGRIASDYPDSVQIDFYNKISDIIINWLANHNQSSHITEVRKELDKCTTYEDVLNHINQIGACLPDDVRGNLSSFARTEFAKYKAQKDEERTPADLDATNKIAKKLYESLLDKVGKDDALKYYNLENRYTGQESLDDIIRDFVAACNKIPQLQPQEIPNLYKDIYQDEKDKINKKENDTNLSIYRKNVITSLKNIGLPAGVVSGVEKELNNCKSYVEIESVFIRYAKSDTAITLTDSQLLNISTSAKHGTPIRSLPSDYNSDNPVAIDASNMVPLDPIEVDEYDEDYITSTYYLNQGNVTFETLAGVFGIPYQYMNTVDKKYNSKFGRKYTEHIINKMPVVFLTPGRPKFMNAYSESARTNLSKAFLDSDESMLKDIIGGDVGKYFSFEFAYSDYINYLNPAAVLLANMLEIGDMQCPYDERVKINGYDWGKWLANKTMANITGASENIAFYVDAETQASESFSNGTGESSIANTVNGLSDMSRELLFLTGSINAGLGNGIQESVDGYFSDMSSKWSNIPILGNIVGRLKQGASAVLTGGKMAFPEIWNDSDYTRDNSSFTVKLRIPDADPLSWYLGIGVPMLALVCMTAPHQLSSTTYSSPFLVRAYSKGFFNIDMGIISSLNITKGDKCQWTLNGLPTSVDIQVNIKDLYEIMMIMDDTKMTNILNNTAMIDYIANMAGININKADIGRMLEIYRDYWVRKVTPRLVWNKVWRGLKEHGDNDIMRIFAGRFN